MNEASTGVVTMGQKPLATATVSREVEQCSRFSECQTQLNGKKLCDLLCVVS